MSPLLETEVKSYVNVVKIFILSWQLYMLSYMKSYCFFLEYAGELRIIALRRKKENKKLLYNDEWLNKARFKHKERV